MAMSSRRSIGHSVGGGSTGFADGATDVAGVWTIDFIAMRSSIRRTRSRISCSCDDGGSGDVGDCSGCAGSGVAISSPYSQHPCLAGATGGVAAGTATDAAAGAGSQHPCLAGVAVGVVTDAAAAAGVVPTLAPAAGWALACWCSLSLLQPANSRTAALAMMPRM
jgi:hypothetical protein